jgi:beta-fructofuranosidase
LEVHVNDRFAVSTWVLPWFEASRSISFLVLGASTGDVGFGDVEIWEGLYDAWPLRT